MTPKDKGLEGIGSFFIFLEHIQVNDYAKYYSECKQLANRQINMVNQVNQLDRIFIIVLDS